MKKFKNISGEKLSIPGIGLIKPEQVVRLPDNFNNANFKKVVKKKKEDKKKDDKEKKDNKSK